MAASSLAISSLFSKIPTFSSASKANPTLAFAFSSKLLPFVKPFPLVLRKVRPFELGIIPKVAFSTELEQEEEEEEEEEEELGVSDGEQVDFSPDLKLFVGNLPFTVDSSQLAGLFERAGNVEMVEVIYDKLTGRSRGFGFITMSTVEEVEAAVQQFNGYTLEGRALRVNSGPPPARDDAPSRGFRDDAPSRGYRSDAPSRGFRSDAPSRGYRSDAPSRGYRSDAPSRGFRDNAPSRGFRDNAPSRGFRDDAPSRGFRDGGNGGDSANRVYVGNLSWDVDNSALENLFSKQGKVLDAKVVYDRESGRSRGFGFVTYSSAKEVNNAIASLNGADLDGRPIRVSEAESRTSRQF